MHNISYYLEGGENLAMIYGGFSVGEIPLCRDFRLFFSGLCHFLGWEGVRRGGERERGRGG